MSNYERLGVKEPQSAEQEKAQTKIEALGARIVELEKECAEKISELQADSKAYINLPKHEKEDTRDSIREKGTAKSYLELPEDARDINYVNDDKGYHFEVSLQNAQKLEVSEADLLTDMRWGIFHKLNHPPIVAKDENKKYNNFRARYIQAYYDKKIAELREQQLIIQRLEIDKVGSHDNLLAAAYKEFSRREEGERKEKAGFIFEKIIAGILQKLALELGEKFGFEFVEADAIDDVEVKADFIVKIKERHHGVGVEELEKDDDHSGKELDRGIQLTLRNFKDEEFKKKVEQVETVKNKLQSLKINNARINSLVLVGIDAGNEEVMGSYHAWDSAGRLPGGPEKRFMAMNVIMKILRQIFAETDLDFEKNKEFETAIGEYFKNNHYQGSTK